MLATRFSPCARYRHRTNVRINAVFVHCKRMISTLANVYNILEKSKEIGNYFEIFFVLLHHIASHGYLRRLHFHSYNTQFRTDLLKKKYSDYQHLIDINISSKKGFEDILTKMGTGVNAQQRAVAVHHWTCLGDLRT